MTKTFEQDELESIVRGDDLPNGVSYIEGEKRELTDTDRWHIYYSLVFKYNNEGVDEFYCVSWREGATEYQDVDSEYYCQQVKPVEKTVVVYVGMDYKD